MWSSWYAIINIAVKCVILSLPHSTQFSAAAGIWTLPPVLLTESTRFCGGGAGNNLRAQNSIFCTRIRNSKSLAFDGERHWLTDEEKRTRRSSTGKQSIMTWGVCVTKWRQLKLTNPWKCNYSIRVLVNKIWLHPSMRWWFSEKSLFDIISRKVYQETLNAPFFSKGKTTASDLSTVLIKKCVNPVEQGLSQ